MGKIKGIKLFVTHHAITRYRQRFNATSNNPAREILGRAYNGELLRGYKVNGVSRKVNVIKLGPFVAVIRKKNHGFAIVTVLRENKDE